MSEESKKLVLAELKKALELEKEGHNFYKKAARKTEDMKGKAMFKFLADEEKKHYKIVDGLIIAMGVKRITMNYDVAIESGLLTETQGGRIWEKSDDLDALNIGINTEKKSIEKYSKIHDETKDKNLKKTMKKLVDEEKRHLSILEKEVEFITNTGEYHDFKTVGM